VTTAADWTAAVAVAQEAPARRGRAWRQLRRDPIAVFAAAILAAFVLTAALAPLIAPDPGQGRGTADVAARDLGPSGAHLMGTDHLGRDVVSRVVMGTRPALGSALSVVLLAVLIGVPLGLAAGYIGGRLDEALSRITDLFLSFPPLLLAMVIAALLGRASCMPCSRSRSRGGRGTRAFRGRSRSRSVARRSSTRRVSSASARRRSSGATCSEMR
jgi:peptide/nickel transport system permease protein